MWSKPQIQPPFSVNPLFSEDSNKDVLKGKKSFTLNIHGIVDKLSHAASVIVEDKVSVYAAQASFFIIISSIPFIMLLFSLSKYIISDGVYNFILSIGENLPANLRSLYMEVISELHSRPAMKLVSLTAVTTFWSASRGIEAVRGGVATVYKSDPGKGPFRNILMSLFYTATFIILIIALVVLLLFGELLNKNLSDKIEIFSYLESAFKYRTAIFFIFLTLFFNCLYYAINKHGYEVEKKFRYHFPGAIVASAGWVLFSFFYSLYTIYFSGASYIYGSLTAIVLLMLWMYFCMIILLFGAEFNKLCAIRRRSKK